jgi:hypothetical protein
MPNHFHFLLRFSHLQEEPDFAKTVSKRLSDFLNSYAKAFNKMYLRKGALFRQSTPRKILKDNHSISSLIHYIHLNPVKHGFTEYPEQWVHSSYNQILNNDNGIVSTQSVLDWMGGKIEFVKFHQTEDSENFQKPFYKRSSRP